MISKIWTILVISALVLGILLGNGAELGPLIISSGKFAFDVYLNIAILIVFWSGIFQIALDSGIIKTLTRYFTRPLKSLFRFKVETPEEEEALELMSANLIANLLGLTSAATPLGLSAMNKLQSVNPNKEVASRPMVIFVLINATAPTIIPTTIFGLRTIYGASTSGGLILGMIVLSFLSLFISLFIERVVYRFRKKEAN